MGTTTTQYAGRVREALEQRFAYAVPPVANQWGGYDVRFDGGYRLRVTPTDGEWDAGFEVHYLSPNDVVCASMHVQAGKVAPAFVVECMVTLLDCEAE